LANRIRADKLLTARGLFSSREKAAEAIEAGRVSVDGKLVEKPSAGVDEGAEITVMPAADYVGRGAYKLEYALDAFKIDLKDRVCLDVGASTGGFTEVMLRRGAAKVYAVDVGTSQLSDKLKGDIRVVNMEKTDIRGVKPSSLDPAPDFCTIDVSFIPLSHVLKNALSLAGDKECVALVKPQFEAGKGAVGKNGVVRDKKTHIAVLKNVFALVRSLDMRVMGAAPSPILGGSGNREYLVWFGRTGGGLPFEPDILAVVDAALKIKN
jgi:23S rRNA (cytidine1920-2'-O)/16S rRNA (cytidine1409-2'-O)-methyltransferase